MSTSSNIEVKIEILNFGKGWFVHVAKQMQVCYSDTLLTPLHLVAVSNKTNFLTDMGEYLWNKTSFSTSVLILAVSLALGFIISANLPLSGEAVNQIVKEYTLLEQSGYLTNAEKWDFLMAYLETGTWILVVLDCAQKLGYFMMLRATLQACASCYAGQYEAIANTLTEITPLPFAAIFTNN